MAHVRLLAVPREARQDQQRGPRGGFWVGEAVVVVHPVQRDLTAVGGADELAGDPHRHFVTQAEEHNTHKQ